MCATDEDFEAVVTFLWIKYILQSNTIFSLELKYVEVNKLESANYIPKRFE